MSVVSYNGVTFPYAQITGFDQQGIGDDLSDTDLTYTKFDVEVQSVVHYSYLSLIAPDLVGRTESPADIMEIIRQRLMERRRPFSIKLGGRELLPKAQEGLTGYVDARNGPIPRSCRLLDLTNESFLFIWRVEAHYWENNEAATGDPLTINNKVGNNVLSNRWAESVEIDQSQYSTRTREGVVVIRSDNVEGRVADQVRGLMAVVGVANKCVRERSSYRVDPSGLKLQYTITDREVAELPPFGAFEAEGNYYESIGRMGVPRHGEVYVRLTGDANVDRTALLNLAILIGMTRIRLRSNGIAVLQGGGVVGGGGTTGVGFTNVIIEHARAGFEFYDKNIVEFRCRAQIPTPPQGGRKLGIAGFVGMGTSTPLSTGSTHKLPYTDRGTAGLLLQAARYYDPKLQSLKLGEDNEPQVNNVRSPHGKAAENFNDPGLRKPGQAGLRPED